MNLPPGCRQQEIDEQYDEQPEYKIKVRNIHNNQWELFNTAVTEDDAFNTAERAVGFSEGYNAVKIIDPDGFVLWSSDGKETSC
jgi:hypothetical protein